MVNYSAATQNHNLPQTQGVFMKVDSHIAHAIDQCIAESKVSAEEFARQLGVSNASITKWRKVGNGITQIRWDGLFPLIRKYLPKDRLYIDDAGKEQYSSAAAKQSSYFFEPKYVPLMVPTFSLTQISAYDDTLESVTQLGERLRVPLSEYRPKHKEKSSIFAIHLDDDLLAPVFPKRTTLFVCGGERPISGGQVVVFAAGAKQPIIGQYIRKGTEFSVVPADGNPKHAISGKVEDAKKLITWIFPVLYYEVVTF